MSENTFSLKNMLLQIKQEDYKVPQHTSAYELAVQMLKEIGSTDPELRDDLIYYTLCKWTENKECTSEQMRRLLQISLSDDYLFQGIGETGTDSVFIRSFSVLIVPLAIYTHQQSNYLTNNEIKNIKEKLIQYLMLERDLRGYVEGKGWAHAVAHAADGLNAIAGLTSLTHTDLFDILTIIKNKICINHYLYTDEEDERMVTSVTTIMNREIVEEESVMKWIRSLGELQISGKYPQDDILKGNSKTLLRSLYFRLLRENKFQKYTDAIIETLNSGIKT
jgi:hypothetical protein